MMLKSILQRLPYLFCGALVAGAVIIFSQGPPAQIMSVHEVDGAAVVGGKLELLFDVRHTRSCASKVDRQLWRWDMVGSQKVRRIVPLPPVSVPISDDGTLVLLTLEVPPSVGPGKWFYRSRTFYSCSLLNMFGGEQPTRSPDVPVTITEGTP